MRTDQTITNRYLVTAGVTRYSVTFPLYEDSDVAVYLSTDGGTTERLLTRGTEYGVERTGDPGQGGFITLTAGVAKTGDVIALVSNVPYTQELDLNGVSVIDTEATETQLDRDCQQRQQLAQMYARTVKVPQTSSKTPEQYWDDFKKDMEDSVEAAASEADRAQGIADEVLDNATYIRRYVQDIPVVKNSIAEVATEDRDGLYWVSQDRAQREDGNEYLRGVVPVKKVGDTLTIVSDGTGVLDEKSVIAEGTDTPRQLKDRFADVINVKDFGAVGDGVTDDTDAIQEAFNSGKSIFFPDGDYIVRNKMNVSVGKGRSFFGKSRANINCNPCAKIIFDYDTEFGDIGIDISVAHIYVENLCFIGKSDQSVSTMTCLRFKRVGNDNTDGNVIGCSFRYFLIAIESWERALQAMDNISENVSVLVKLCWNKEDGGEGPGQEQYLPYGNRATRICRNRRHTVSPVSGVAGAGSIVWNVGEVMRSAMICENISDIGGTILYDEKGMENCIVSGNITDCGNKPAIVEAGGKIYNSVITGNTFSYQYSHIPNTIPTESVMNMLQLDAADIDGLVISNNLFVGFGRRAISLTGTNSAYASSTYKNISVIGNTFDFSIATGYLTAAVMYACQIDGLSFVGNVFSGSVSNVTAAICTTNDIYKLRNLTCIGNVLSGAVSVNNQNALITPRVWQYSDIKVLVGANDPAKGTLVVNTPDTGLTTLALINKQSETQAIAFINANDIVGLAMRSDSGLNEFYPTSDARRQPNLGKSSNPWKAVFAETSSINTSDERLKANIAAPNDALMRAWGKVGFKVFQFKDAVAEKGENARIHVGVIAQEVQNAFASEGLDASRFGLFCHDSWEDEFVEKSVVDTEAYEDLDGTFHPEVRHTERVQTREAGDKFAIRYEEALALECAYQRWELNKIKERLDATGSRNA